MRKGKIVKKRGSEALPEDGPISPLTLYGISK